MGVSPIPVGAPLVPPQRQEGVREHGLEIEEIELPRALIAWGGVGTAVSRTWRRMCGPHRVPRVEDSPSECRPQTSWPSLNSAIAESPWTG